jgi:hypothetical protein
MTTLTKIVQKKITHTALVQYLTIEQSIETLQDVSGLSADVLLVCVLTERPNRSDVRQALVEKRKKTVAAYQAAGEPIPKPRRSGGSERALATIRKLGEKEFIPIF